MIAAKLAALLPLLVLHLLPGWQERLSHEQRERLASFVGGVAAAYVFLIVLPKLATQQEMLEAAIAANALVDYLYHHAYLAALVGFAGFYLVTVLVKVKEGVVTWSLSGIATVTGFALYLALIGDLIAAYAPDPLALALFSVALTLHVIGLHLLLFEKVQRSWPWLRLVLGASLGIGWLVGVSGLVPPASHALLSAGLAGGIIINVVLHELPGERRPLTFLAGILTFTALLKLSLYLTGTEGSV